MKTKIYLLTTVLVSFTVLMALFFSTYSLWVNLKDGKFKEVASISKLLDEHLEGTYLSQLPEEADLTTEALNNELQPLIEKISASYPGYGVGYYVKELNSIVAFGPDFKEEGLIDISPESLARTVYQTKEPYQFHNYSQTRNGIVVANIRPIIRDGEVIGHVWGNVLIDDLKATFLQKLSSILVIYIMMLVVGILGSNIIVKQYTGNLKEFKELVNNLDLSRQDAPKFTEELMSVYNEVVSSRNALIESEKRFRDVVTAFEEFVWEIDLSGTYTYLSDRVTSILGYTPEELLGTKTYDLIPEEQVQSVKEIIERHKREHTAFRNLEYKKRKKDGGIVYLSSSSIPIMNDQDEVIGFRGATRDISIRKMHEARVQNLAYYDQLTNLPNRTSLMKDVADYISNNVPFALVFIDIDQFKTINDSLGHTMGDELLRVFATRIKQSVHKDSKVYRFGGDEFIIILRQFNGINHLKKRLTEIMQQVTIPIQLEDRQLFNSISMGASLYPDHGINYETLIKNADMAMYKAKENGRKQFIIYEELFEDFVKERFEFSNDLNNAIFQNEFVLNYQPQVELQTQKIVGVEALVRWQHPTKGLISPVKFIRIAEETNLIIELGQWILKRACLDRKAWLEKGVNDIRVAVNISIKQFQQEDFVHCVLRILEETGLDPAYLELEITESIAMIHPGDVIQKLHELKNHNIFISIDDFGTGFSSLNYLKELPINQLKVDRSFIRDITENNDLAIVQSIMALAQSLNLSVVAEGVETEEQAQILRQFQYPYAQGYHYYKPMPVEELEQVFEQQY